MPGRDIPLIDGQYYHVFNRGVAGQPVFYSKRMYDRFIETMRYYQYKDVSLKYSHFLRLPVEERSHLLSELSQGKNVLVRIIAYCLMQNHFHVLVLQQSTNGISKFIGDLTNSYTRYVNTKHNRTGPLFAGKFKAVRIEDDKQLLHVVRYIHLNPYTSYIVKSIEDLVSYPYSSLRFYMQKEETDEVVRDPVLENFKTIESFKKFTFDQADYQRKLRDIKHLLLEN